MSRLFNPDDWFGRHQGITLVLLALLLIVAGAL
jgi:hypothetical protein